MILPTIHMNGTAASDLYQENRNAAHALREALRQLHNAAPNGRDYYPQGPAAINVALAEHGARIELLERVLEELNGIAEHIAASL
jgi:uncharacterized membrane protein YdfJ with MMPL/SSD domain